MILPHSRCNCRCVMCDIWRIRQVREITAADLAPHMASLRELKVRWVVFSGGEPLMHSDLSALARMLRREGIRTTLLTAGLTLERHAAQIAEGMDDVIVSLDGPREIHDRIRGVPDAYRSAGARDSRPPGPPPWHADSWAVHRSENELSPSARCRGDGTGIEVKFYLLSCCRYFVRCL